MIDEAQRVILELGLHNVHIELVKLLGRLQVPNKLWTKQSYACKRSGVDKWDDGV